MQGSKNLLISISIYLSICLSICLNFLLRDREQFLLSYVNRASAALVEYVSDMQLHVYQNWKAQASCSCQSTPSSVLASADAPGLVFSMGCVTHAINGKIVQFIPKNLKNLFKETADMSHAVNGI